MSAAALAVAPRATARPSLLDGLDFARTWAGIHDAIPVSSIHCGEDGTVTICKRCTTTAQVDAIAARLGITAERHGTSYTAVLPLGLYREYRVFCVTAEVPLPAVSAA